MFGNKSFVLDMKTAKGKNPRLNRRGHNAGYDFVFAKVNLLVIGINRANGKQLIPLDKNIVSSCNIGVYQYIINWTHIDPYFNVGPALSLLFFHPSSWQHFFCIGILNLNGRYRLVLRLSPYGEGKSGGVIDRATTTAEGQDVYTSKSIAQCLVSLPEKNKR